MTGQSVSMFLGMCECPVAQWIESVMLRVHSALAYLLIAHASCCSHAVSMWATHLIATCKSLHSAKVATLFRLQPLFTWNRVSECNSNCAVRNIDHLLLSDTVVAAENFPAVSV